jgi:DNA-binding transcriptional regulator YiaG
VFGIDLENDNEADKTPATPPSAPPKAAQPAKPKKAPAFKPTAAKLRALRKKRGLSMAAFAREIGVSGPTISNWEKKSGALKIQPAPLEKLQRLLETAE